MTLENIALYTLVIGDLLTMVYVYLSIKRMNDQKREIARLKRLIAERTTQ